MLGLLVIIWILVTSVNKSGLPSGLAKVINADYENFRGLKPFDSTEVLEVRERIAGFWTYTSGAQGDPVVKREYMEIIGNGIVWMVRVWELRAPDGERHELTQVATGYVSPYSYASGGSGYYSEMLIIRQAYMFGGDTCYGASQSNEMWEVELSGSGVGVDTVGGSGRALTVNRREYRPYVGDIKKFFPEGVNLKIVDAISLVGCPAAISLPWASKKLLARSMNAVPFFARAGMVDSLINSYYKPLVLEELARRYDPRAVPDVIDVSMTIAADGTVTALKHRGAKVITKRFDDLAVPDMKSWLYPAVMDSNEPQTLDILVRIK